MIPLNELVLAYELRQQACEWKRIAQGLDCNPDELREQVRHLERNGIPKLTWARIRRGLEPKEATWPEA